MSPTTPPTKALMSETPPRYNLVRWWMYLAIVMPVICTVSTAVLMAVDLWPDVATDFTLERIAIITGMSALVGGLAGGIVAAHEIGMYFIVLATVWVRKQLFTTPDD